MAACQRLTGKLKLARKMLALQNFFAPKALRRCSSQHDEFPLCYSGGLVHNTQVKRIAATSARPASHQTQWSPWGLGDAGPNSRLVNSS